MFAPMDAARLTWLARLVIAGAVAECEASPHRDPVGDAIPRGEIDQMWIIIVYVMASIVLSISAGARAGIMVGVAFAAGSVLAVAVGGGLRASLLGPTKQKVWGSVIAALLLALGLWVGTHFSATLFEVYVSGPVWVVIGAVVCFLFVDKKMLRE